MSIVAYTGLPGSGKSYGVVEHVIVPALVEGRAVYTNIPLNELEIFKYLQTKGMNRINIHPFSIDDAKEKEGYMAGIPGGAVIVIDEIWRLWPSGMKANGAKEDHKSFVFPAPAGMNRHDGVPEPGQECVPRTRGDEP
jgi:zona occludens toxin